MTRISQRLAAAVASAVALFLLVLTTLSISVASASGTLIRLSFVPAGDHSQRGKVQFFKDSNTIERVWVTYRRLDGPAPSPACPFRMSQDHGHRLRDRTMRKPGALVVRTPRLPRERYVLCVYMASGAKRDATRAVARGQLVGRLTKVRP